MKPPTIHKIPVTCCPECGQPINATHSSQGDHKPKAGDISMCSRCGHVAVFKEDLQLRHPDKDELKRINSSPAVMHARAMLLAHVLAAVVVVEVESSPPIHGNN